MAIFITGLIQDFWSGWVQPLKNGTVGGDAQPPISSAEGTKLRAGVQGASPEKIENSSRATMRFPGIWE
jgi:hypothetical protein